MNPPRIPAWLLRRFVSNDALIGDFTEEFRRGRSGWWYWRQALGSVLLGAYQDVCLHKLMTLRAIVVGWGVLTVPWSIGRTFFFRLPPGLFEVSYVLFMSIVASASGWVVRRWHRPGMVLAYALFVLVFGLGWLVVLAVEQPHIYDTYPFYFPAWAVVQVLYFLSIIFGGLWGARREDLTSRTMS
jgi:hypothetical protein